MHQKTSSAREFSLLWWCCTLHHCLGEVFWDSKEGGIYDYNNKIARKKICRNYLGDCVYNGCLIFCIGRCWYPLCGPPFPRWHLWPWLANWNINNGDLLSQIILFRTAKIKAVSNQPGEFPGQSQNKQENCPHSVPADSYCFHSYRAFNGCLYHGFVFTIFS